MSDSDEVEATIITGEALNLPQSSDETAVGTGTGTTNVVVAPIAPPQGQPPVAYPPGQAPPAGHQPTQLAKHHRLPSHNSKALRPLHLVHPPLHKGTQQGLAHRRKALLPTLMLPAMAINVDGAPAAAPPTGGYPAGYAPVAGGPPVAGGTTSRWRTNGRW